MRDTENTDCQKIEAKKWLWVKYFSGILIALTIIFGVLIFTTHVSNVAALRFLCSLGALISFMQIILKYKFDLDREEVSPFGSMFAFSWFVVLAFIADKLAPIIFTFS